MGHVWLIGMMGSGKTTVGAAVADRLGLPFVDSDVEVTAATGRSIAQLFAESEDTFRSAERAVIARIASLDDHIVATGGGAVLDQANVDLMRSSGTTILLGADPRTLSARLAGTKDRPLLTDGDAIATIAVARTSVYAASADMVVDTTDRDIDEVIQEVVRCVAT
jgi:shikimate kinase